MTDSTWTKQKINDHCEITSSKRIFAGEYLSLGVPFYRGKEISEKQRSSSEVSDLIYISREKFEGIKSKYGVPQKGDLLLTSVGTIGNPYLVKENEEFYFKDGNLTWFKSFKDLNSKWLYYWLLSPEGKSELNKSTIGSSQKAYTIQLLSKMQFTLPELEMQNKIANTLSSYDDLIENNEKRVKILEEMVQRLYTEWFVNFKFPGHEKVKMVESLPEGWKVVLMKDIAEVIDCLHTKKPEDIKVGNNILLQLNNILDNGLIDLSKRYLISDGDYKKWTKNIELREGDCVVTNVGRIAAVAQVPRNIMAAAGRNMTVIRPTEISASFLIQYLKSEHMTREVKRKTDAGAIMGSLNVKNIYLLKVILPKQDILKRFDSIATTLIKQMEILHQSSLSLKEIRDLLIPQLVTGRRELKQ